MRSKSYSILVATMSNASEVYTRLLLLRGHGCPVWCPEPDENLSLAFRGGGVRIGHVGSIDPDGGFDPLFDICSRPDDPINHEGVPEQFEQLVLGPTDVKCRSKYHNRGSHLCSESLQIRPNRVDANHTSETNM